MGLFDLCMEEARSLKYGSFSPELDNLDSRTIEDILFRVQSEIDLVNENESYFEEESEESKRNWVNKAKAFISKWESIR